MVLENKKILVGVTGSIAAYKVAHLVRLLVKEKALVKVVMTKTATDFITPLTLSTLSKNPVGLSFSEAKTGEWTNHVELGLWADLLLIAPASANTIGKSANGICDNLLQVVYLSARCPVYFAPAMDLDMFLHPSTSENILKLQRFGNHIIEPNEGELASGLSGKGRMAEPEEIIKVLEKHFRQNSDLNGKIVVITAGPTQEDLDPVRYISNHSSGKMGFELAKSFKSSGAEVYLVTGPSTLPNPDGVNRINVRSAEEMYQAVENLHAKADIVIFSAAVADYKPATVSTTKIKKTGNQMHIDLEKTVDIAGELGKKKKAGQIHVGFALETNNEAENAKGKLERKNFDLIVLNSLQDKGAGFRYDTNKITIFDKNGDKQQFPLKPKEEVATDIKAAVLKFLNP